MELEFSKRYGEATSCYVEGHFKACIALLGSLLELILKLELEKRQVKVERKTLGFLISCASCHGILSQSDLVKDARFVSESRNIILHLGLDEDQKWHERIPLEQLPERMKPRPIVERGYAMYEYKHLALEALASLRRITEFLYGSSGRNQHPTSS
jgi:hypothetical protein